MEDVPNAPNTRVFNTGDLVAAPEATNMVESKDEKCDNPIINIIEWYGDGMRCMPDPLPGPTSYYNEKIDYSAVKPCPKCTRKGLPPPGTRGSCLNCLQKVVMSMTSYNPEDPKCPHFTSWVCYCKGK